MEFRVLGPLTVLREGVVIPVAGRLRPRLLATLLLAEGNAVPLTALMDTCWDGEPPATAKRQIQNAMAGLRRDLGDSEGALIQVAGDGYLLRLDSSELDCSRFTDAVVKARRLRGSRDFQDALDVLRDALGLWQGIALDGLTGCRIEALAADLEEQRLAAIEERVELELLLGQHAAVIDELRELLTHHPFRERMAAVLMLALYRDGQGGAALRVYDVIAARLADEQGIDPGQALRDRRDAIERGDPIDDAPMLVQNGAKVSVPALLPAAVASFTGREEQLGALDALVNGKSSLAVITGIGGSGKTALAVHWAHRERENYPDGQLYVNLRGFDTGDPVSTMDALGQLLPALGVPANTIPSDIEATAELYRERTRRRRMVVVLDNARDAEQVVPLLPGEGCLVLVTSRDRLSALSARPAAQAIDLDMMDLGDSLSVLARLVGSARLDTEPQAARRLVTLCGGLPLALRIAAANLAVYPEWSIAGYVTELDGPERIELLAVDGDPEATVAATFDLSYRALTADAQRLLVQLGLIPGEDFNGDLAATVGELSSSECQRLLNVLVSSHLLEQHRPQRYRFHDLLHDYARHRAANVLDAVDHGTAEDRIAHWYYSNRTSDGFSTEVGNVIAACRAWREHPRSIELASVLGTYVNRGLNLPSMRGCIESAFRSAKSLGSPLKLFQTTHALSIVAAIAGETEAAIEYQRQAVKHAMDHDGDAVGTAHGNLGMTYQLHGDYRQAESALHRSLAMAQSAENGSRRIHTVYSLTSIYIAQGEYDKADQAVRQLRDLALLADNPFPAGGIHLPQVELYIDTGRYDAALSEVENGLRIARESSQPRFECDSLVLRAEIRRKTGDPTAAESDIALAADLARLHELSTSMIDVLHEQSLIWIGRERTRQLQEVMRELTDLAHNTASRQAQARIRETLCAIHNKLGDYEAALLFGARAAAIYADMPFVLRHARTLDSLADAHTGLGDHATARDCREKALSIFTRLDAPEAPALRRRIANPASD